MVGNLWSFGKAAVIGVTMEFFKVYGILLVCAGVIIVLALTLYSCVQKVKRLEKRIEGMQDEIVKRLDEMIENAGEDQKKQRRLFTESMSGLTESVTRAVCSIKSKEE